LGLALGASPDDLIALVPDLLTARSAGFIQQLGRGLAVGVKDRLATWVWLISSAKDTKGVGVPTFLKGYFAEVGRVDRDLFRQLIEAVQEDDQISAWLLPLLSGIGFNDHELPFLLELASSDAVATKDFVNLAYLDCLAGLSAASRLAFVKVLLRRHGGPEAVFCLLWRFWYGVNAENIISMDTDEIVSTAE
jgi:hypothetical protein